MPLNHLILICMLNKINGRYRSYCDGKNMYALDIDSNLISLTAGLGHTYFFKKGYVIKRGDDKHLAISDTKGSMSLWTASGISIFLSVIIRVIFGNTSFQNNYIKLALLLIPILITFFIRILWSKQQKKKFFNSFPIDREIKVKLDYGNKNQMKRLLGTFLGNILFIITFFVFSIIFFVSGNVQMYIGYLIIQAAVIFCNVISTPSTGKSPLYDFKIILVE